MLINRLQSDCTSHYHAVIMYNKCSDQFVFRISIRAGGTCNEVTWLYKPSSWYISRIKVQSALKVQHALAKGSLTRCHKCN